MTVHCINYRTNSYCEPMVGKSHLWGNINCDCLGIDNRRYCLGIDNRAVVKDKRQRIVVNFPVMLAGFCLF